MKKKSAALLIILAATLTGCGSVSQPVDAVSDTDVIETVAPESDGTADYSGYLESFSDVYAVNDGDIVPDELDISNPDSDALWEEYEAAKDAPAERDEDGSVVLEIDNIMFVYSGETDVQIVREEGSDFVLVSGLDGESSMGIGVYEGHSADEMYGILEQKNHQMTDINGNDYYIAYSIDGTSWYYGFVDVTDKKVVIVDGAGDFGPENLDVYLPLAESYDVNYK
jgi:hypothetical protein